MKESRILVRESLWIPPSSKNQTAISLILKERAFSNQLSPRTGGKRVITMETEREFFICPTCFHVSEVHPENHQHRMFRFPGFPLGHQQLKPPVDGEGNLLSRAPRWFLRGKLPVSTSMVNRVERRSQQQRVRPVLQPDNHGKPVIGEVSWAI